MRDNKRPVASLMQFSSFVSFLFLLRRRREEKKYEMKYERRSFS